MKEIKLSQKTEENNGHDLSLTVFSVAVLYGLAVLAISKNWAYLGVDVYDSHPEIFTQYGALMCAVVFPGYFFIRRITGRLFDGLAALFLIELMLSFCWMLRVSPVLCLLGLSSVLIMGAFFAGYAIMRLWGFLLSVSASAAFICYYY